MIQGLKAEELLKVGKLYKDRTDFVKALPYLVQASELSLQENNFDQYLDAQNIIIRIYAETGRQEEVEKIKESLQDLVLKNNFELSPKTFYVLGLCAIHKDQNSIAKEYFTKSLNLALQENSKKDICYAIFGIATSYAKAGQFNEALKEIYNIKVFFQVINLPELEVYIKLLNANILRKLERFDESLEVLWQSFEEVKSSKNLFSYLSILYSIGLTYKVKGDHHMAKIYLSLALTTMDKDNLKIFHSIVEKTLEEISGNQSANFDIIFNKDKKYISEKSKGEIDFKNQFILLDLLKLFMTTPGQVYSKEEIVNKIWQQNYDPRVHDNKLYVTIKRLRRLIEPENEKPKYLFRAKNGYYFNKDVKVLLS